MPERFVIGSMPDDVKAYIKARAKKKGVSMAKFVVDLIRADAKKHGQNLSEMKQAGNPEWIPE